MRTKQLPFMVHLFREGFYTEDINKSSIVQKGFQQKLYLLALRSKCAKTMDKVFNSEKEYILCRLLMLIKKSH